MKSSLYYIFFLGYVIFGSLGALIIFYSTKNSDFNTIEASDYSLTGYFFLIFLIIYSISLILILLFTIFIFIPLKKISIAASEYAKGNFSYTGLNSVNGDDEIGRLANSLNYMAYKLRSHEEDQRKFISNISHDFRSPLTSIKGYVEALKDGTIPPESQEKYLDIVLFETARLTKLTSSLLEFNTWDEKNNLLNYTNFDINRVIKQVLSSFENACTKKHISFDIYFSAKSYQVTADIDKIMQVLYNLIDNAIKFSSLNSTVYIKTKGRGEKVFVSVKDTGQGIAKEDLAKIFDRFFKTDPSRGRDKKGTGLGLSIVKEIINSHGENINVVSTEGIGTEFTFTLQRKKKSSKIKQPDRA